MIPVPDAFRGSNAAASLKPAEAELRRLWREAALPRQ